MKRVRLRVAYDGTHYCGWQIQKNGVTIEEVLNRHLSELLCENITVTGASRTDAGVHALGNVAVFDTQTRIPSDKLSFALNQRLPDDIRIRESDEVHSDWHPRYTNSIKTYEYKILNSRFDIPTERFYSYFVYRPLDVQKMKDAVKYIKGEHDFQSFCSAGAQVKDTVRTVYEIELSKEQDMIYIRISGSGFLYNMVRIIAGTLVNVGHGVYEPEYVKNILQKKDRHYAGPTAPAHGLMLIGIAYDSQ